MIRRLMRVAVACLVVGAAGAVGACHTLDGFGEDVEEFGEGIQEFADTD